MDIHSLERACARLQTERAHALSSLTDEETRLQEAKQTLQDAEQAQNVLQGVAQFVQGETHDKLAGVVTRCLDSVFGDDQSYTFKIEFVKKRGKTEARLYFVDKQDNELDPVSACGGGIIDVASFALRVACLMMSKPSLRRVLFLDEPFRFVSKKYRAAVRDLLSSLSEETKIQMIVVTHDLEFQLGEVIELD